LNGSLSDWFIYHTVAEGGVSVCTLRDALRLFKAFHDSAPNHEVITVHLELKGQDTEGTSTFATYGPDMLDATLAGTIGRQNIFAPGDLLAANPGSATLFVAAGNAINPGDAASGGWPTIEALRGKFIFVVHGSEFQKYATESNAYSRIAFIMHNGLWDDDNFILGVQHIVFWAEVDRPSILAHLRSRFPGLILRSKQADDSAGFGLLQAGANLLLTDKVDFHVNPWIRTHNANLFPFGRVGQIGDASWTNNSVVNLKEDAAFYVLKTYSGDLDGNKDSFSYVYSSTPSPTPRDSWTALIATVSNGTTHAWGKGLLMARTSLDPSSPYFAVGRAADQHGLFIQWRSPGCGSNPCGTAHEELGDPESIEVENVQFIRMDLEGVGNNSQLCRGFGSVDGKTWHQIFKDVVIDSKMPLRGMAASSLWTHHPNDSTEWFFFQDLRRNGTPLAGSQWAITGVSDEPVATTLVDLSASK